METMKPRHKKPSDLQATLHLRLDLDLKAAIDGLIASNDGIGNYSQHVRRAIEDYVEKMTRRNDIIRAAEDATEYKTPPPKRRPKA
jgi:Arc/MetJ-type ribon-helix-helix transcriptional regulator